VRSAVSSGGAVTGLALDFPEYDDDPLPRIGAILAHAAVGAAGGALGARFGRQWHADKLYDIERFQLPPLSKFDSQLTRMAPTIAGYALGEIAVVAGKMVMNDPGVFSGILPTVSIGRGD
jgi:hypothetical protein